ncbi:MAG: SUMF1/EgtB/PvdO family nonheme iron enzyme [Candidatus Tenebribacter davisii]|nr:SUMF1/EgtB/PvdO family nonheme iron enzyme [Candidatus Tenebribacter davisii]
MKMLLGLLLINLFILISCEKTPTEVDPSLPQGFVFVEGCTFDMGDHFNEGEDDELPIHNVTLNSFYMGITEVTQAEYEEVVDENPAYSYGIGKNYPVYYVTWYDAVTFCNLKSEQDNLTPCYDLIDWSCDFYADGYRLPTEAEWEFAARGGVNWTDNYKYSGTTDHLGDYAWFNDNSSTHAHEVSTKLPNQLGIYDMTGNVWEWCNDWYSADYYSNSPNENPQGPISGSWRIIRGAPYTYGYSSCRVSHRDALHSYYYLRWGGFRIVKNVEL